MQVTIGITDHAIISLLIIKSLYETKNQTADEIRRSLTKEGVDAIVAGRTLDSMIRSRSHFDRSSGGKGMVYSLKKDAARDFKSSSLLEVINDTKKAVLEDKLNDDELIAYMLKITNGTIASTHNLGLMETVRELARGIRFANGISVPPVVTTARAAVQSIATGGSAMQVALANARLLPKVPRSKHDQFEAKVQEMAKEKSVPKAESPQVAIDPTHVFNPQVDTIEVAIWKVMADGKQYTVSELEVLLGDAKMFSVNSLSPKLSQLRRDQQIVRAVDRKGRTVTYELIPGTPVPEQSTRGPVAPHNKKYGGRTMPTVIDPTLPPDSLAPKAPEVIIPKETNIEKEEPEMKKVNPPVTVKPTTSILEVSIKVRGVEMPLSELKAIVGVFDSVYNVHDEKHDEPNKIVAVNYTVGSTVYSLADARALVLAYKNHFE